VSRAPFRAMRPGSCNGETLSAELRVLHVVGDSQFGGGAVIILRLAGLARRMGLKADILTTNPEFQIAATDAGIGIVDIDAIRRAIRPAFDARGAIRLRRYLRSTRVDVVHTHTSKAGVVGRWAAHGARVPVVVHTVHGFAFHDGSPRTVIAACVFLERIAAQWCDRIVTVSEHHRRESERLGIGRPSQVVAIPNGIDPRRVAPERGAAATRRSLGLDDRDFVVVTMSRLARQKGLEELVRAAGPLSSRLGRPLRMLIAGDGPERARLEALARSLGVADVVRILGFRTDVGDLLACADLAVLPTLREGLSIALLEAMAAGKAVVTTGIPSNLEATQNGTCARIVPPADQDALSDAIVELAADPVRRSTLGARALEVFQRTYTEERMLSQYADLYRELLAEKGLGGSWRQPARDAVLATHSSVR
jgi:glycosyltransferase involved in cell wall biosynthesis